MLPLALALLLTTAALVTPAAQTPAPALESPALPAASDQYVHTIVRGDTLIGIVQALLSNPQEWHVIQAGRSPAAAVGDAATTRVAWDTLLCWRRSVSRSCAGGRDDEGRGGGTSACPDSV